VGDCCRQLLGVRRLTLSGFSHLIVACLAITTLFRFEQRIVDAFWNRKMLPARASCGTHGLPSDTRLLVSCQQHVKGLTA
jgi:hypothetical protein